MQPSQTSFAMAAAASSSGPHPWRRYFARSLDYLWYFPVAGFTITAGFVLLLSKEEAALFFSIPDFVLTLILIAVWLPIEAGSSLCWGRPRRNGSSASASRRKAAVASGSGPPWREPFGSGSRDWVSAFRSSR